MAQEIRFNGSSAPLSNMFMAGITWRGQLHKSTEFAFQHEKLVFHEEYDKAKEVLDQENGFKAKEKGKIAVSREWLDKRVGVMESLLFTKFHSVRPYREAVLSPGIFLENTLDSFWGLGTRYRPGQNTLGRLHMDLRSKIEDRILIIGTSHTRNMDIYTHELLLEGQHYTKCDVICMPGGIVSRVKDRVMREDLSAYSAILVICGGNNLFTRQGDIATPPKKLALELQDLQDYFARTYPSTITVFAPVFPRRVSIIPTIYPLPASHFVKRNKLTKYVNKISSPSFDLPEFWCGQHANREFFNSDGVHLTPDGKRLVVKKFMDLI